MKKNALEVYNKIVAANIGELVCTKYNGKNYEYTIVDALNQQGYKKGIDYDTVFDWGKCQTYIKKLAEIKPYTEPKHNIKPGDIFTFIKLLRPRQKQLHCAKLKAKALITTPII